MRTSAKTGLWIAIGLVILGWWLGAGWILDDGSGARREAVTHPKASPSAAKGGPIERLPPVPRTAVATDGASEAGEAEIEVLVVEKDNAHPVAQASVRWCAVPDGDVWWESPAWDLGTIDSWMDAHGQLVQVLADGSARVPRPAEGTFSVVVGEVSGLWGRCLLESGAEGPQRLELESDGAVRVGTVRPGGAPIAGVTVALRGGPWGESRHTRVTGEKGWATLPHVGLRMRLEPAETEWSVAVEALLPEPLEERLDPTALPLVPVVFVLPDTGSVEVSVGALPGGPSPEGGEVRLAPVSDGPILRAGRWIRPGERTAPIVGGRALFESVGLDLDLDLEARGAQSLLPTRARIRGPAAPGEARQVGVQLGADHPVLRLRLVDETGAPVPGGEVSTELQQSTVLSSTSSEAALIADAAGVIHHDLAGEWIEGSERRLRITVRRPESSEVLEAEVDLSRGFPDGVVDLGDVHLLGGDVLAAGMVVDSSGAPRPWARISVELPREWSEDETWFEEREELGTHADGAGRFEVRGPTGTSKVRLRGRTAELAGAPLVVPAGSTDVVLGLAAAGSVAGRVLVDQGVRIEELLVELLPAPGPSGNRGEATAWTLLREDGSFECGGLYPGLYDLTLRVRPTGEELARIDAVTVPEGDACADARLAAIDLRRNLCSFVLELQAPRAGMEVSGIVLLRPSGAEPGSEGEQVRYFSDPRVPITARATALDLEVLAAGFRRVRLESVRVDTRVQLEEGPLVRLRLAAGVELPPAPGGLRVLVGAEPDLWAVGHTQDAVFGEERELVLHLQEPGEQQVLWTLEERSGSSPATVSLGFGVPATIQVSDATGEQVFDVAPDPEAYAQALGQRDAR